MSGKVPKVDGCVAARTPESLTEILPRWHGVLGQNIGNAVLAQGEGMVKGMEGAINRLGNVCRELPREWVSQQKWEMGELIREMVSKAERRVPSKLRREEIIKCKQYVNRHYVVLPLDKNVGKPIVLCKNLYARLLMEAYGDETQFEVLADFTNGEGARDFASARI